MAENRTDLVQQTADTLREKIRSGEYGRGEKLPNENELSSDLGVSRTTLREAIRILVSDGLLNVYRGRGTYVADEIDRVTDLGIFQEKKVRLRDLYEARLIFEPEAAALACTRASDEEISNILELGRRLQDQFELDSASSRVIECEKAFHDAIISAAHNSVFDSFIPMINQTIEKTFELEYKWELVAEGAHSDNVLIMEFLQKRDSVALRSIMTIHLRRAVMTEQLDTGA
jgi:GntR family transcriptional repressor for pyruvate dehydrogenase complex